MKRSPETPLPPRSRRYRIAWVFSIAAHAILLLVAAVWWVNRPPSRQRASSMIASSGSAGQVSAARSSPEVTEKQVAATLDHSRQAIETKPEHEQLDLFDQKAKQLEEISSSASVDEISTKFHAWMETKERASEPKPAPLAEKPAGEAGTEAEPEKPRSFDFDTAQIHDIRRETTADGYRYITILVDSQGLTMESELSAEEGATAYATFERLKKFPLANQVYRKIAMPLMDKILAAQRQAKQPEPAKVELVPPADADQSRDPFDEGS